MHFHYLSLPNVTCLAPVIHKVQRSRRNVSKPCHTSLF